ncbi:MAG: hypothetical protein LBT41_01065 [Candidatus Methanoplasma sp.]|jgi:hypothetical protein|nr:hypothetical protein [Candidatus Methanoplasma sp.]
MTTSVSVQSVVEKTAVFLRGADIVHRAMINVNTDSVNASVAPCGEEAVVLEWRVRNGRKSVFEHASKLNTIHTM